MASRPKRLAGAATAADCNLRLPNLAIAVIASIRELLMLTWNLRRFDPSGMEDADPLLTFYRPERLVERGLAILALPFPHC